MNTDIATWVAEGLKDYKEVACTVFPALSPHVSNQQERSLEFASGTPSDEILVRNDK